jgi:fermentation-respiration switch protein FrsA (DUF1100 family)
MRNLIVAMLLASAVSPARPPAMEGIPIRGRTQVLRLYGPREGPPVIVSSGDGGWIHLGPHVAEVLSAKGYFVVGFDSRAYLSSFTSGREALRPEDVQRDYLQLAAFAGGTGHQRPILIGVSEGAGLSVMAAAGPATKAAIGGVVGLGLPDVNELGWRWKDTLIYLTHGVPHEPTFRASNLAGLVAPVPLAAIHSTHDEYVPLSQVQGVLAAAGEPKRLWIVPAADHRFSDNLGEFDRRLFEALDWISRHAADR